MIDLRMDSSIYKEGGENRVVKRDIKGVSHRYKLDFFSEMRHFAPGRERKMCGKTKEIREPSKDF